MCIYVHFTFFSSLILAVSILNIKSEEMVTIFIDFEELNTSNIFQVAQSFESRYKKGCLDIRGGIGPHECPSDTWK